MEIKEKLTIEDLIENRMDLIKKSDVAKKNILKRRLFYFIFMIFSVLLLLFSVSRKYSAVIILSGVYSIWGFFGVVFAKKDFFNHNKNNLRRNILITAKQYGLETKEIESITEVENDKITIKEWGTTFVFFKSDYLRHTENEKSYIIEFTNGRFIYLKKTSFETKEHFLDLINEIQSNRNDYH